MSSPVDTYDSLAELLANRHDDFCDASSILLVISESNFAEMSQLKEPKDTIEFFIGSSDWSVDTVQMVQYQLLSFLNLLGDLPLNKNISTRLDRIRKSAIVGYESPRKLMSLLSLIKEKQDEQKSATPKRVDEDHTFYQSGVFAIREQIEALSNNIEDVELLSRAKEIANKLDKQKFSIGITGVMNAGKSTMLNALLGKELLGTSVIPETANLSIIKYANKPRASVNFWNTKEWKNIEISAKSLEGMRSFVADTREHFSNAFADYITPEGRSIEISMDTLPSYTSAEHSDMKCNLVKSVELYTDLEFVKNGVEIVDTPGLDDPVIQREEITKSYLMGCDLLCHLMNAGQSATQKDIDFIVDSLLYRSVAQLLVVITRIDTVTAEELGEVIEYTKSSIKAKLKSLNKSTQINSIIERISFIPIAGKMALLHRTGRADEALRLGYSLDKSGIKDIEEYLRAVLFGDNSQKAKLIIEASQIELGLLSRTQIDAFEAEQRLLGKNADEIADEYAAYQDEIATTKVNMSKLEESIEEGRGELVEYFTVLDNFAAHKLKSLQELLKRRVFDDVSYELRKNKKKPSRERIATMIETGMKDGFLDVLRDYRYQFQKKVGDVLDKIDRDFDGFSMDNAVGSANTKEFFEKHFSALDLVNSNTVLIQNVNKDISSYKKKELEALDISLQKHFEIAIDELYDKFKAKAGIVGEELLGDFVKQCKAPLDKIEFEISSRQKILQDASNRAKDISFDASRRAAEIASKLQILRTIGEKI